ncbi:Vacuolar protein sorting-associated protein 33A [Grifola frondosa]|uniref:Vacuolar protein sorting-associated protein 33A n=1 Tax=Grifola frondosa TaxID=5627 RepID=A0A1C7MPU2_GRIFR|nr:Vacuolar protein sorting-associated protein 33A [Grifola frondosa]
MAVPSASSSDVPISNHHHEEDNLLDVSIFKELGRKALVDALNSVNGAKTLVLDPSLAGPLGLVTVALLKHHGVDKMFWLEAGPLSATTTNIVYLCRPLIKWVKIIADQIKRHARESQKQTYTLFLVPRPPPSLLVSSRRKVSWGMSPSHPNNLQFIPLADDVISLENDNAFKELWVDGDETVIYNSMQALLTLQKLHGVFPRIVGKGDYASRLATLLTRNLPQGSANATPDSPLGASSEKMDSLIILDRRVDMITPLLTQLTYEGLIDELIGIKNSHVELPVSLLAPPVTPNPPRHVVVEGEKEETSSYDPTDPLLTELQDLNFSSVGKKLNQIARRLDEDYKLRHQAKTVAQLRDFVGKLPLPTINPPTQSLPPNTRRLSQPQNIPTQRSGSLFVSSSTIPTPWRSLRTTSATSIRDTRRLVSGSSNGRCEDVRNGKGASPGTVQAHPIVGWKGFEDVIASIPGETVDIMQRVPGAPEAVPPASSLMSRGTLYHHEQRPQFFDRYHRHYQRSQHYRQYRGVGGDSSKDPAYKLKDLEDTRLMQEYSSRGCPCCPLHRICCHGRHHKCAEWAPPPAKKSKRRKSTGGGRKKLTDFNKFMQTEVARLKEENPDMAHKDRFKLVIDNWNKQKEVK